MPTILGTRTHAWADEGGCAIDAARLASHPGLGEARVELLGPLGAGKTTFARHLLRALGVPGTVKSPTYTLLEPYAADAAHGGFAIAHCDFYRFEDPAEWEEAGFRDVFSQPCLALVEWPQKAAGLLPAPDLSIAIEPDPVHDESRVVTVVAWTPRGVELLW